MITLTKERAIVISLVIIFGSLAAALAYMPYAEHTQPEDVVCGVQECHGLNITCGSDVPDVCTEIYMLGDFCRQHAQCKVVNGECTLVENFNFKKCKECAENCQQIQEPNEAFLCEDYCRDLYDKPIS